MEWKGKKYRVPKVLLGGDHKKIEEWRVSVQEKSQKSTKGLLLSDKKLKELLAISAEMDADVKNQKAFTNANDLIRDLKLLE